jgi:acyl-CoA synthetase (AMP-forming)/AMP-acid ligase II
MAAPAGHGAQGGGRQRPQPAGRRAGRCCAALALGGYLKRPQLNATSADGWFDTGDVATIDAEGYIRITGRTKDVVIRGGENIPVVEIENLLYQHPAIAVVAIVGYPDRRLGERVCAFVSVKQGASFSFQEMVSYLEGRQVAKQYWPERLEDRRRPAPHAQRQAAEVQAAGHRQVLWRCRVRPPMNQPILIETHGGRPDPPQPAGGPSTPSTTR